VRKTKKVHVPVKPIRILVVVSILATLLVVGTLAGKFFWQVNQQQEEGEVETPTLSTPVARRLQPDNVPVVDITKRYPFVLPENTAAVETQPKTTQVQELPIIPGTSRPVEGKDQNANADLPVIPGSAASAANSLSRETGTIQGILTGSDGASIAILRNGKIVKEGDTVDTGKIAAINSAGIRLEGGHIIPYGEQ